jgi:hypothetical protein
MYNQFMGPTGLKQRFDRYVAEQFGHLWWKKTELTPEDTTRADRQRAASSTLDAENSAFNSFMGN